MSLTTQPSTAIQTTFGGFTTDSPLFAGNAFKVDGDINVDGNRVSRCRSDAAKALTFKGFSQRKDQIPFAASESFDWIWSSPLLEWLENGSGIFWITGKPGSGKSTLMRHLIDHQSTRLALQMVEEFPVQILHFFFDYSSGRELPNTLQGLLRCLLQQMAVQSETVAKCLCDHMDLQDIETSSAVTLLDLFKTATQQERKRYCLFVDGLDEYADQISDLMKILRHLQSSTGAKLVLASRDILSISTHLLAYPKIIMEDYNGETVRAYLCAWNIELSAEMKNPCPDEILKDIVDRADGVILWARFAFQDIVDYCADGQSHSIEELRCRLSSLPKQVQEMYARTLERIRPQLRLEAAIYLLIIDATSRSTSITMLHKLITAARHRAPGNFEISENLKLSQFKQRLMAILGALLTLHVQIFGFDADEFKGSAASRIKPHSVDVSTPLFGQSVRFIHQTMHRYLIDCKWCEVQILSAYDQVSDQNENILQHIFGDSVSAELSERGFKMLITTYTFRCDPSHKENTKIRYLDGKGHKRSRVAMHTQESTFPSLSGVTHTQYFRRGIWVFDYELRLDFAEIFLGSIPLIWSHQSRNSLKYSLKFYLYIGDPLTYKSDDNDWVRKFTHTDQFAISEIKGDLEERITFNDNRKSIPLYPAACSHHTSITLDALRCVDSQSGVKNLLDKLKNNEKNSQTVSANALVCLKKNAKRINTTKMPDTYQQPISLRLQGATFDQDLRSSLLRSETLSPTIKAMPGAWPGED